MFVPDNVTRMATAHIENLFLGPSENASVNESWPNANLVYYDDCPSDSLKDRDYPSMALEFAKIMYGFVFLIGFFGNSLVIYVVLRFSKMQTVTNMYIFNLALADVMFLIGLVFLEITIVYQYWMFGRLLCKIYMTITSINQFTSTLLLTVMSADRYIAVCHPISAPKYRAPFIAKFICLTVWMISCMLVLPIYMYSNTKELAKTVTCNIIWPKSDQEKGAKTFTLYSFTLGFFVPFILIFLFYVLVLIKLRRVGPKHKSKEKKRSHRKVTYLVLTVIAIYVLCWLPYWIGQLYITFFFDNDGHAKADIPFQALLLVSCLSYANSAVNPILYAFLSENFKKSFAKAFTCAAGKDVNAQLNAENSIFPKPPRGSMSTKKSNTGMRDKVDEVENFSSTIAAAAVPLISPSEQKNLL